MEEELVPPPNFGVVEWGIYRSGYPSMENMAFLKKLGIRSVVYVCRGPCRNKEYLERNGMKVFHLGMEGKKDLLVSMPEDVMRDVLRVLLDVTNYPLLVHCNAGKHRSGRVVGCLRKIQKWDMKAILDEYQSYAVDKCRARDEEFIQVFDGSSLAKLVQDWSIFVSCWKFVVFLQHVFVLNLQEISQLAVEVDKGGKHIHKLKS